MATRCTCARSPAGFLICRETTKARNEANHVAYCDESRCGTGGTYSPGHRLLHCCAQSAGTWTPGTDLSTGGGARVDGGGNLVRAGKTVPCDLSGHVPLYASG